jgi:Gloeo_Verruco repeat
MILAVIVGPTVSVNDGSWGLGGIYEIDLNGTFTNLYSFTGSDAYAPRAGLFQGADGTLYGTTLSDTLYNGGAIFRLTTNQLSFLHFFDGTNGSNVEEPLIQARDGNLFGVALSCLGTNDEGHGCIFRITKEGIFTNLFMFDGMVGHTPLGPLIQATDGNLYGVTVMGGLSFGTPYGTIFRISTNGAFTHVASFYGTNGARPNGGLVQGPDGNFYGTTQQGGAYTNQYAQGAGTIFRVAANGDITTLFSFDGTNGLLPVAGLTLGADGKFYGTTQLGGVSNKGNIFRLTVDMPPLFRSIAKSNTSINLAWSAISARTYQLQYCNLAPNTWSNSGPPITATNGIVVLSDSVSETSARLYPVMMLP